MVELIRDRTPLGLLLDSADCPNLRRLDGLAEEEVEEELMLESEAADVKVRLTIATWTGCRSKEVERTCGIGDCSLRPRSA